MHNPPTLKFAEELKKVAEDLSVLETVFPDQFNATCEKICQYCYHESAIQIDNFIFESEDETALQIFSPEEAIPVLNQLYWETCQIRDLYADLLQIADTVKNKTYEVGIMYAIDFALRIRSTVWQGEIGSYVEEIERIITE